MSNTVYGLSVDAAHAEKLAHLWAQRLIVLGASRIRDVTQGFARWTTFADPEGNEFDLITGRDMKGSQGVCTRVRANASANRSPGSTEAQEWK
ncbi:VOC family protein [Streptomyces lydicus]|uniref:VOC family protein n=1 Tax=Streptomyces lydicus TaxID=47763 RepID=UPI0037AA4FC2